MLTKGRVAAFGERAIWSGDAERSRTGTKIDQWVRMSNMTFDRAVCQGSPKSGVLTTVHCRVTWEERLFFGRAC